MYVVNNLLQYVLSTGKIEVSISALVSHASMKDTDGIRFENPADGQNDHPKPLAQGGLPPEEKLIIFMVLMSILDLAKEYLDHVARSRGYVSDTQLADVATASSQTLRDSFPLHKGAESVAALHL
ncbi:hypothetical protein FVEG_14938 [Fusarium verticillioides 7600]|uniref:Uncharacterized protein n=1 Tax=Gibberella moniliformis (strain M3125 / FGSC 7600) TaxID=334819 RepID=W7M163_GIBM7|nr:hypothetical protein FVEG_14938 [Fusarium verticillioides 7600]EWG38662.1 hypothetical protein FVEG_14938 [Fusarium verticillioides 7600]